MLNCILLQLPLLESSIIYLSHVVTTADIGQPGMDVFDQEGHLLDKLKNQPQKHVDKFHFGIKNTTIPVAIFVVSILQSPDLQTQPAESVLYLEKSKMKEKNIRTVRLFFFFLNWYQPQTRQYSC